MLERPLRKIDELGKSKTLPIELATDDETKTGDE
jgi:hypothetical protein